MGWGGELSRVAALTDVRQRIDEYRGLLRQHDDAAVVWFNLATDLQRTGEQAAAMAATARALAIDPMLQRLLPAELRGAMRVPLKAEALIGRPLGNYSVTGVLTRSETQVVLAGRSRAGAEVALRCLIDVDDQLAREALNSELLPEPRIPGVVRVLDSFDADDGRVWQVLEPLRGRTLLDLSGRGFLGLRTAAELIQALARVVIAVHERGLVHGQLLPDLVFFDEDPDAKEPVQLLGVSRRPDLLLHGISPFRVRWLSPDVGTDAGIGRATDVYGLGMLLYFCLRGKTPPRLGQRQTIGIADKSDGDPREAALNDIVAKAMAVTPADRYGTVTEFLTAFERAWMSPPPAPAPPTLLLSERVVGRYRLTRLIGQGSFGAVYEAVHVDIANKLAAVKLVLPEISLSEKAKQQFLEEANIVARVDDPHIVQLYDSGRLEDGSYYLVMELLRGCSFFDLLRAQRAHREAPGLGVTRTLKLALQMTSALRAAHSQNVVHRDLKPENLFVLKPGSVDEFVKVLDFGISKLAGDDRGALASIMSGTPAYMPPEQWSVGAPIDPRSDVYSLGVILYECLMGELPFRGPTVEDYRHQHAEVAPPALAADVPAELGILLARMLAKALAERPASVDEVQKALAEILDRQRLPPPAPPASPRRRRAWWPLALGGAALLAASGVVLPHILHKQDSGVRVVKLEDDVVMRPLSSTDLQSINDDDLRVLRNVPFARHGHRFANATLSAYFQARPWYGGVPVAEESALSRTESANVELIGAELTRRGVAVTVDDG